MRIPVGVALVVLASGCAARRNDWSLSGSRQVDDRSVFAACSKVLETKTLAALYADNPRVGAICFDVARYKADADLRAEQEYAARQRRSALIMQAGSDFADAFVDERPRPAYGTPDEYVGGYFRQDGNYVDPYMRTTGNGTETDNYGAQGNYNPYTGRKGTQAPKY